MAVPSFGPIRHVLAPTVMVASLLLPAPAGAQRAAAAPEDVASPEAIVQAMYETINRSPGENFDWDRLRTLYLPEATMIPSREQTGGVFRVMSVEEFIDWVDENTIVGGPNDSGLQEEEIARRIERYGDVAQVFSTYEKRFWGDSEVLDRGVNAIQLVHDEGRWWVGGVVWDEEVGAGPLPDRYLPIGSESASDELAIRGLIAAHYVAAVFDTRDESSVRRGFHSMFRLYALDDGQLIAVSLDEWLGHLGLDGERSGADVEHEVAFVDVTGDAAVLRAELFLDERHVYTDYFSLYRVPDQGWRIVSKIFESHGS